MAPEVLRCFAAFLAKAARRAGRWAAIALVPALVAIARPATALDTAETWDRGAGDIEAYARIAHPRGPERVVAIDGLAGYGLMPRLSIFAAATYERSDSRADWIPG